MNPDNTSPNDNQSPPVAPPSYQQPNQTITPPQPQSPREAEVQQTVATQPAYAQSQKSKKPLIIGLIIAGVVALLGLMLLVLVLLAGPSKDDYKKAMDTTEEARSAWNGISGTYVNTSGTKTELDNALTKLKENANKFSNSLDTLSKNKAVNKDKDVKQKWDAVEAKRANFDAAMNARIEAYEKILPIAMSMNETPSSPDAALAMLENMQTDINAISGLQDSNNKSYVERIKTDLVKLIEAVRKVKAMRENPRTYDSAVLNDFYDLQTELRNADRDWKSNLEKKMEDGNMRSEMSALADVISEKYNSKK